MTEVSNFSEAWEAYIHQHGNPPTDANQLHKYSKINKEISDITYPIARLQYAFNKKVLQIGNDEGGACNDIETEITRLKKQHGQNYVQLLDRDFFEFGKVYNDKTRITIMQYNIGLDLLIGQEKKAKKNDEKIDEKSDEKSDEKEISFDNWQYRGYRIIEIISKYSPDIITIQDINHFKFMCHYLTPLGYDGVLKLNTKSKLLQGVAIFYARNYFEKITTFMYGKDVEKGTKFDLYAVTLLLKHKKSDKNMVICSANLDSNDKIQSRMNKLSHLMESLKNISDNYSNGAIFIGCDLGNNESSDEYCSIQFGSSFVNEKGKNKNIPKNYQQGYGLNLCSAYYESFYKGKTRRCEPGTTVFGGKCRDYIFFDQDKDVSCSNILTLPIDKEINQYKSYPNCQSPSKHFPLMAQFFV